MFRLLNNGLKKMIHRWLFSYEYDLKILEGGRKPLKTYKNDAGYDLYISRGVVIPAGQVVNVNTGVACKGSGVNAWIFLTARSSTLHRHGLLVDNAVIDGDYVGELSMVVFNPTKEDIYLHPGMRLGQIIVIPHTTIKFNNVEKLKIRKGERGDSGFGSTGK